MIQSTLTYTITLIFIILWSSTALPKFFDHDKFGKILGSQSIPKWMVPILTWLLPPIELFNVILLFFPQTRLYGLCLSFLLMFIFTIYVSGIFFRLYETTPCSCGEMFKNVGWKKHFYINVVLSLTALTGILLNYIDL